MSNIGIGGEYTLHHYDKDGNLKEVYQFNNAITKEGLKHHIGLDDLWLQKINGAGNKTDNNLTFQFITPSGADSGALPVIRVESDGTSYDFDTNNNLFTRIYRGRYTWSTNKPQSMAKVEVPMWTNNGARNVVAKYSSVDIKNRDGVPTTVILEDGDTMDFKYIHKVSFEGLNTTINGVDLGEMGAVNVQICPVILSTTKNTITDLQDFCFSALSNSVAASVYTGAKPEGLSDTEYALKGEVEVNFYNSNFGNPYYPLANNTVIAKGKAAYGVMTWDNAAQTWSRTITTYIVPAVAVPTAVNSFYIPPFRRGMGLKVRLSKPFSKQVTDDLRFTLNIGIVIGRI